MFKVEKSDSPSGSETFRLISCKILYIYILHFIHTLALESGSHHSVTVLKNEKYTLDQRAIDFILQNFCLNVMHLSEFL